MRLEPTKAGAAHTMCFLLGNTSRARFCFWCGIIILRSSFIPDKPALVAGCLRVPTDASGQTRVACALRSLSLAGWGAPSGLRPGVPAVTPAPVVARPEARASPWRRLGDASPLSRQFAGSPRLFSKAYRSVQLIFFLKFGDRNKSRRKILCECQKRPQIGALHSIGNRIFAALRS